MIIIDLKGKQQSVEFLIENEWNFKPLLSLSEDIDFPKVQQFEQHTFQIYKSIVDSFAKYKSKQDWCRKTIEEIQQQEACAKSLLSYVSDMNKIKGESSVSDMIKKFRDNIR